MVFNGLDLLQILVFIFLWDLQLLYDRFERGLSLVVKVFDSIGIDGNYGNIEGLEDGLILGLKLGLLNVNKQNLFDDDFVYCHNAEIQDHRNDGANQHVSNRLAHHSKRNS